LLAALPQAVAQIRPAPDVPLEQVITDQLGGATEHFSIDQYGTAAWPTEYVSVGRRELPGGGYGLHVARYTRTHSMLAESVFVSQMGSDLVGYSVDTMANDDLLIAGEMRDAADPPTMNVFVCRMTRDLLPLWGLQLKGSYNGRPAVTARELADGSISVAHNQWPTPGGDLEPGYGRLTRLSPGGTNLIWSRRYEVPNSAFGQVAFADVRQAPDSNNQGDLWVAGSVSQFLLNEALLLRVRLSDGGCDGDMGFTYPHPLFDNTAFTSLYFDERVGSSFYTIVAAGYAVGSDIFSVARPRVVDVPAIGGAQNWDLLFANVRMAPAPTALTVTRGAYPTAQARIVIAGTKTSSASGATEARIMGLDPDSVPAGKFVYGYGFGNGAPPETNFNDISDSQVMVGGYRASSAAPSDLYYVGRGPSACAAWFHGTDAGPGTFGFFQPDCIPDESLADLTLTDIGAFSAGDVICHWSAIFR
jgi:hypothetical protein